VPQKHSEFGRADRLSSNDEFIGGDRKDLTAHDSGILWPKNKSDRDQRVEKSLIAERRSGSNCHRENDRGK
jgi:hypothetical protein